MTTWLKPTDVAKRLNISRRQAYYLITNGDLPSVQFSPQTTRVDEEELNKFIENRKRQNAATS